MRFFLAAAFVLAGPLVACSQQDAATPLASVKHQAEPEQAYTYVEHMPELLTGGGMSALVSALQRNVKVPKVAGAPDWKRTMVYFVVGPSGVIHSEKIVTSSEVPAYDQATLQAVRALPRLKPGYQNGRPVSVAFTIPIAIHIQY
jgi:protein TonB